MTLRDGKNVNSRTLFAPLDKFPWGTLAGILAGILACPTDRKNNRRHPTDIERRQFNLAAKPGRIAMARTHCRNFPSLPAPPLLEYPLPKRDRPGPSTPAHPPAPPCQRPMCNQVCNRPSPPTHLPCEKTMAFYRSLFLATLLVCPFRCHLSPAPRLLCSLPRPPLPIVLHRDHTTQSQQSHVTVTA